MKCKDVINVIKQLWCVRAPILSVAVISVALPLPLLINTPEAKTAYVLLVMAVLWLTEAIPIPVTSLLPIVLFPALGVAHAKRVSSNYITDTSMLFIGGLMVAVAVEGWNLHKRIALSVLRLVGSDPKWIMAGLMLPTWFLSMWISNTATASMMIPIVQAVLLQLKPQGPKGNKLAMTNSSFKTEHTQGSYKSKNMNAIEEKKETGNEEYNEVGEHREDGPTKFDMENAVETSLSDIKDKGVAFSDVNLTHKNPQSPTTAKLVNNDIGFIPDDQPEGGKYTLDEGQDETHDVEYRRLCKGLSLSIAYAANVGGLATLTGSPPNLVLKGQADILFRRYGGDSGITFANFMQMALPLSIMTLVIGWFWLFVLFIRFKNCCRRSDERSAAVRRAIQNEFKAMGRITFAECVILAMFILFAVMLLTRRGQNFSGWEVWFPKEYVTDSSSAIFVSVLLFILPAKIPTVFCWQYKNGIHQRPSYTPILTWEMVHTKLPWGVIVLLGGGFALADACQASGLSDMVGTSLESLKTLDPILANFLLCLVVAMVTEVTSNTATATLLMPVMAELSLKTGLNPLYLMMSAALATSFAFMLPVATPPNAIVFSHGHLRIPDMALAGLMMNVIAVLCLTLCINTWAGAVYNFSSIPAIFHNSTTSPPS